MRKTCLYFFCLTVLVSALNCASCTDTFASSEKKKNGNTFTLAEWNVQNLFNAKDDGDEYEEYAASSGWDENAYKARLERMKTVFSYFEADAAVLVEVENEDVVSDIIKTLGAYRYFSVCKTKGSAIAVAIISKYPIMRSRIHTVEDARSVLEAEIETQNEVVNIFAFHAKSKKGGEEETALQRIKLAETLNTLATERIKKTGRTVFLAGDFNTTPDDTSVFNDARYLTGRETGKTKTGVISISSYPGENAFYDFMLDSSYSPSAEGTYCYNGEWEHIDYILMSHSPNRVPKNADIVFQGILKNNTDEPNRYSRSLLSGVSDHLPIYLQTEYRDN